MKARTTVISLLLLGMATAAFAFDIGGAVGSFGKKLGEKALTDPNAQKGLSGLTLQEEIDIGDSVSVEIVGRYSGVWRSSVAIQRVNLVGRTLAKYAKRDSFEWCFGVLDSDAVNAFSAPNGKVFITRGLYKLLANDDELAAVLAHEIAHVDLRHAAEIIEGMQRNAALSGAAGETIGEEVGKSAGALSPAAQFIGEMAGKISDGLLNKGYGPEREYRADKAAYELLKVCGFNPDALRIALTKVDANTAKAKETFSTHPKTSDRLKKLPGGEKKKGK